MLKTLSIIAASLATAALASPALADSFVHKGSTYVYSVEQRGKVRLITGEDTTTHRPFALRVANGWVEGSVDGSPVSFSLNDVKAVVPQPTVTTVATR